MDDTELGQRAKLAYLTEYYIPHHEGLSQALVGFSQSALRIAFLLNGGAIIAALSVYAALSGAASGIAYAIGSWVFGLLLAALSVFLAAIAQRQFQVTTGRAMNAYAESLGVAVNTGGAEYTDENVDFMRGRTALKLEILCWWLSIFAFCAGAWAAMQGLR